MSEVAASYGVPQKLRETVRVTRFSKRLAVRIPPEIRALGWEAGRELFTDVRDGSIAADAYDFDGAERDSVRQVNKSFYWPISDDIAARAGIEYGDVLRLSGTVGRLRLDRPVGIDAGMNNLYDSWFAIQARAGRNKVEALELLSQSTGENLGRMALSRWKSGRRPSAEIINRMVADVMAELVDAGETIDRDNVSAVIEALHLCEAEKEKEVEDERD